MSQITTHVLNTSQGKPAQGIGVSLLKYSGGQWEPLTSGITDQDGRVSDLLETGVKLSQDKYRLEFELESYFAELGVSTFYPEASVVFMVRDQSHYHIPLLLSPFGYTTYRGS